MREIIRLDDIRRDFIVGDETVHALRGVSFTINEGEFVTIMSSSGSGSVDSLFVKTDYRLLRIGLDDILYVEGLKDYVRIRFWKSSFLRTDSYGCTVRISSSLRRCRISREEGSYSAR